MDNALAEKDIVERLPILRWLRLEAFAHANSAIDENSSAAQSDWHSERSERFEQAASHIEQLQKTIETLLDKEKPSRSADLRNAVAAVLARYPSEFIESADCKLVECTAPFPDAYSVRETALYRTIADRVLDVVLNWPADRLNPIPSSTDLKGEK